MDVICRICSYDGYFRPDSDGQNEENVLLNEFEERRDFLGY